MFYIKIMNIDLYEKRKPKQSKKGSPHLKEFFGIPTSAEFFYFKDAQANIVALLDNTGTVVVKYNYDAWGNCKVLNSSKLCYTQPLHLHGMLSVDLKNSGDVCHEAIHT